MSVLIFRLNGVPDDEAADVRALLDEHGFAYHETTGGFLGFGVAGLWLLDDSHKAAARAVIDDYQRSRSARLAAEHEAARLAGRAETTPQRIARHPVQSLFYIAGAAGVLYLMLWPFLTLGR
ncbi:hypothetical protein CKO31_04065 [Thiohalocapsa halophila]|uniref:DUF2007 domain-containing protein n=1 Tax=Thiohalocapsa halophila TaxID=69359 RepID=A0ABS1CDF6_9GAMM|nr:DUF6164 family protein [Thiohalocapsa halophila]MBK1629930.1 hypothetical protein [Thiohalocapsa halophila]